ncbi:MAG: serine/threonine-protein kinase [Planctomycetota bacterium]
MRPLGKGGMGTVYLATDPRTGARVAVKTVSADVTDGGQTLKRFAKEVEILSRLEHPNIVRALGPLERDGDSWYFAMEYVEGRTLAAILKECGRLEPERAAFFLREVLLALEAAHAQGVLHRDLKPSNVLVDRKPRVMLSDFGVARAVDLTRLTTSGMALGTPAYMAPEQIEGRDADERSDLYSVGVMAYEMVTGRLPFVAENPYAVLKMHQETAPRPPRQAFEDIPPALEAAILCAMAKSPAQRFSSAAEFRAALVGAFPSGEDEAVRRSGVWLEGIVSRETVALDGPGDGARPRAWVGVGVAAGVVLLAAVAWRAMAPGPDVPPPGPSPGPSAAAPQRRVELTFPDKSTVRGRLEALDAAHGFVRIVDEKGERRTYELRGVVSMKNLPE